LEVYRCGGRSIGVVEKGDLNLNNVGRNITFVPSF
jgi:hypothetical protein